MSPFFHGGVRPVKKYARPWSLNPRLNPELSKGNARMSILGLPSFETGIETPVFNGVYPKPSRDELSNVDETVVVSSNGDLDSELVKEQPRDIEVPVVQANATINPTAPSDGENAAPEVIGSDAEHSKQLDPIVEAPEIKAPVEENAKGITSVRPSESTPPSGPVPDEPSLPETELVQQAESPVIKNFAEHGSLKEAAVPAIETIEAEQPPVDETGTKEVTEAESGHRADDLGTTTDPVDSIASPVQTGIEQTQDKPAEPLPSVSEEPMEDEDPVHDSQISELGLDEQAESVSGPAGLGPLEVIKEEPPVAEEPVTAVREDSAVEESNLHGDKGLETQAVRIGGLEPVDETPEILENPTTGRDEAAVEEISAPQSHEVTGSGEQADEDTTPVVEKPEFSAGGVTGGRVQHPAFDRKDSMFETPYETPFETPMEKPLNNNNNNATEEEPTPYETSFETPMERPFWASGGAADAIPREPTEPEHLYEENDNEEPAEGPFIPRHSPELEPTTTGDVKQTWNTAHDNAKGGHGGNEDEEEEEQHIFAPSAETVSGAASATDVEPLLSDEMLDVDDEFRPGVKTQSIDYSSRVNGS